MKACFTNHSVSGPVLNYHSYSLPSHPFDPKVSVVQSLVYEARYDASAGLSGNDESLLKAVAYQCAALLCNVYEKHDTANVFLSLAAALCNNGKQ